MISTQLLTKFIFAFTFSFFVMPLGNAQTKKIKRPTSAVGVSSIDSFVRESFDLYDKVYKYDGYAEAGTPLDDNDIDVLEDALDDLNILNENTLDVVSDIDGIGVFKQSKATLQLNKSKKVLKYSIRTAKDLLSNNKKSEDSDEDESDNPSTGDDDQNSSDGSTPTANEGSGNEEEEEDSNVSDNLEIYSKFDFVPGDKLIYFDDFSQDFVGDFPSKWNTNGSGEVVRMNNVDGNWFEVKPGYYIYYIPLIERELPEEFTVEFDILTSGLDRQTSSTAMLNVIFDDNDSFRLGADMAQVDIPFCQYIAVGIIIQNKKDGHREIYSKVAADLRKTILNQPHVSIAVNKQRFRMWINEKKYVDVPRLVPEGNKLKYLKFGLNSLKESKDQIFLNNLKIAEGGLDLRRQLMTEGSVSTNGILFDSGSANIQPQSYGIIRQISQVLMQDDAINLNIVGHTDADGNDDTNLKLSKARAEAVKQALITVYKISGERLQTDGKGESNPVGDNNTADGKAKNRRVVFIKI